MEKSVAKQSGSLEKRIDPGKILSKRILSMLVS
jgi:hypothetical protein